jgi:hypothetical protein
MGPATGQATGQGTKESGLKTAPALDHRNSALDPPTLENATGAGSSTGDCLSLFIDWHRLAKKILISIAPFAKF